MSGAVPLLALTGGSGFVGRHFAAAARRSGWRIRHLARRSPAGPEDEWRSFDLDTREGADLTGCAALVHLAAYIPSDHRDLAAAERCWRINALGTLHLVDAAIRAGVGRIMQASSANAYAPTGRPPDEATPLFPQPGLLSGVEGRSGNLRGGTLPGEAVLLQAVRLASVYGPGQQSGALGLMMKAAASGEPIRVHGGGAFGSDLVHVDDVARAMLLLLGSGQAGAFNVGSGVRTTIAELAELLSEQTGAPIVHEGRAEEDWGFPALNIDRLKALGYQPRSLADGLSTLG